MRLTKERSKLGSKPSVYVKFVHLQKLVETYQNISSLKNLIGKTEGRFHPPLECASQIGPSVIPYACSAIALKKTER